MVVTITTMVVTMRVMVVKSNLSRNVVLTVTAKIWLVLDVIMVDHNDEEENKEEL